MLVHHMKVYRMKECHKRESLLLLVLLMPSSFLLGVHKAQRVLHSLEPF